MSRLAPCSVDARGAFGGVAVHLSDELRVPDEPERCDYVDNDCNGAVDDNGVRFDCGDCNPACLREPFGRGGRDLVPRDYPSEHSHVRAEDDGTITLIEGNTRGYVTLVFDESRNGDCPPKHGPIDIGAELPEGSRLIFESRGAIWEDQLEAVEWGAVLDLPGGQTPAPVFTPEQDQYWMFVALRITFLAAPSGASPRLDWLTVDHRYIPCPD